MKENPVVELQRFGQSVWYDNVRRGLLTSGELQEMIDGGEITGVTSNPTIFQKAIAGSTDYDVPLAALVRNDPQAAAESLYEGLVVEDIRAVAEALLPVYERTLGKDGYVSVEVAPRLAHDTEGTVAEAQRLFAAVGRPNVMIKVPATAEGIPAVTRLIGKGINVNVTLMFSLQDYLDVSEAYLAGLEELARSGGNLAGVASVASFFVSRVDTAVDRVLSEDSPLRGRIAIANAKVTFLRFKELSESRRFDLLRQQGGRVQRLLWASTGVKNPQYRDVMYIEELIGPDTVTTVPPATLDGFRDHGRPRPSLSENPAEATRQLRSLRELGIDLDAVTRRLKDEGVESFARSFDSLMETLTEKRDRILGGGVKAHVFALGPYSDIIEARQREWADARVSRRIWQRDGTVWVPDPDEAARTSDLTNRLGWLTAADSMYEGIGELTDFAGKIREEGFTHVVLLGMGGSSLAPEVFMETFGNEPGYPPLTVLDSTHPASVEDVARSVDLARTLFIVSSKSGTTLETISFFKYFHDALGNLKERPGENFLAITDPGSRLESLAREKEFRRVFLSPPEVGGRYSALTYFGLLPAALIGLDLEKLLDRAITMVEGTRPCVPVADNPALVLGAAMGELALAGRDKMTFLASPGISPFPVWVEQLIAESTGKRGKGILPVVGETLALPDHYGDDRFFVYIRLEGDENQSLDRGVSALEAAGHPVARISLHEKEDLGGEFFRWEMATAAVGALLGINPFDQPDVEAAKVKARELMAAFQKTGNLPGDKPLLVDGEIEVYGGRSGNSIEERFADFLDQAVPGDYLAVMAYTPRTAGTGEVLDRIRLALRDRSRRATTLGYGPRFLHSTGQLHKGGSNRGLFIQITHRPERDLSIPGEPYTFGRLIAAQAMGDYQVLAERGRRLIRFHITGDLRAGLERLEGSLPHWRRSLRG
ncbi:MAG: bifunctional transaldolase/phosoglucose isomerase [Deltaproteobacteria bacterium]|nr:bifunctional transaldolase/phosoglucose isomerase [Deltaproteobacteria bacterium]MBW2120531.1 bifunctional transaldolase/phosoglucose isomerase [Deltaproteobacteria bacterium]